MKTKLIIAAIAALGATAAFAGPRMEAADADGDGKISIAEFQAAHDARMKEKFSRMDTNGDGFLSKDEIQAGHKGRHDRKGMGGHRPEMTPEMAISRLDTDKNGSVSLKEFENRRFGPDADMFKSADADGNGELDAGELRAMMEAHRGRARDMGPDRKD